MFCYNPLMTKIHFTANGYTLAGNIFVATKPQNLAFLFIQGWMGRQNTKAAQKLAELGFTSMTYDMRGNGASKGNLAEFSRADFIRDAVVAYDYLRQQVGDDTRIGIVGSSFGSYTGILLTEEREVYCLSLRVPANYPDEGFEDPQMPQAGTDALMAWRHKTLHYQDNRALRALHDFKGPVHIVESENDDLVPHQTLQNYALAVADPTLLRYDLMKNAPHSLLDAELQASHQRLLVDWVQTEAV